MDQLLPCPRCGAPRVVAKTWVEEIETATGTSPVKHTLMVCPDAECQQHVDEEVAKQEQKRVAAIQAKEQRLHRAHNQTSSKS